MRGVYYVEFAHDSLVGNVAKNLIILEAPLAVPDVANVTFEVLNARVTNKDIETNEQIEFGLFRASGGTKGTPGATFTPTPMEVIDPASRVLASHTWTTDPTIGVALDHQGVPTLSGYSFDPTPEERPIVRAGGFLVLRLVTTTFTPFDALATIVFREIG